MIFLLTLVFLPTQAFQWWVVFCLCSPSISYVLLCLAWAVRSDFNGAFNVTSHDKESYCQGSCLVSVAVTISSMNILQSNNPTLNPFFFRRNWGSICWICLSFNNYICTKIYSITVTILLKQNIRTFLVLIRF